MAIAAHVYGAPQLRIIKIFRIDYGIKKMRIHLKKGYIKFMKMIHVITLFLVVIGGLHFALTGLGVNLLGTVFGSGKNLTILYIIVGLSTLYHVVPMLKIKLTSMNA